MYLIAIKFTDDALKNFVKVPRPFLKTVLNGCVEWAKENGVTLIKDEHVKIINDNGGNMPDAVGVPEDQLRQASKMAVCKINIDSDIRLAMTANIRKCFVEKPDVFDPRTYLGDARKAVKDMVSHKIVNVLGCNGKAE